MKYIPIKKQKTKDFKKEFEDERNDVENTHFFKIIEDRMDECVKNNDKKTLRILFNLTNNMRRWLWVKNYNLEKKIENYKDSNASKEFNPVIRELEEQKYLLEELMSQGSKCSCKRKKQIMKWISCMCEQNNIEK